MIRLHKLSHDREPFHLNSDLIATIEAHPDTMLHLTTGVRLAVAETVDEVVAKARDWRIQIAAGALGADREQ
ncbi:MAG: flagellar FlbD family protein [Solirubrobacterales bacterium]